MVCLDTSFIIDIWRGKPEAIAIKNTLKQQEEIFTIATPVIMELAAGAQLSERIESEKQKIRQFLLDNTILHFDAESAFRAGEIRADLEKRGEEIDAEDIMIGAIAIQNGETVVTRNVKHFKKIKGLKIQGY